MARVLASPALASIINTYPDNATEDHVARLRRGVRRLVDLAVRRRRRDVAGSRLNVDQQRRLQLLPRSRCLAASAAARAARHRWLVNG